MPLYKPNPLQAVLAHRTLILCSSCIARGPELCVVAVAADGRRMGDPALATATGIGFQWKSSTGGTQARIQHAGHMSAPQKSMINGYKGKDK